MLETTVLSQTDKNINARK